MPIQAHLPPMWSLFTVILCMSFLSYALCYLIGSIPFGLLLGKLFGAGDIRTIGSGNIGATNMLRTGRKGLAAATLLLDGLKGYVAVLLCRSNLLGIDYHPFVNRVFPPVRLPQTMPQLTISLATPTTLYLCAVAAVLGHIYPLWLNFKGGKGVATTLGVYFALQPLAGLLTVIAWLVTFLLTKYSSLAAIVAIGLSPVFGLLTGDPLFCCMALVLAIIVIAKHKENIHRLRSGTESGWKRKT